MNEFVFTFDLWLILGVQQQPVEGNGKAKEKHIRGEDLRGDEITNSEQF